MSNVTEIPRRPRRVPNQRDGLPKKELMPLTPISREELEEILGKLGEVATLVGKCVVHDKALTINGRLKDIEETVLGMLPGGERFDHCEGCGVSLGVDDEFVSDVEGNYLCPSCADEL